MRRIRSGCCARAVSGHAAVPPRSETNWRRRMGFPQPEGSHPSTLECCVVQHSKNWLTTSESDQQENPPFSGLCQLWPAADIEPANWAFNFVGTKRGVSYFRLRLTPGRRSRRWRCFRRKGCRPLPIIAPLGQQTTCRLAPRGMPRLSNPAAMARNDRVYLFHASPCLGWPIPHGS
jgi:hypothetical protein